MIRNALVTNLLVAPQLAGVRAILLVVAALAVPTFILFLDFGLHQGACYSAYIPFVLFSAVMVTPAYAAAVALGAAGLTDALFLGPHYALMETRMAEFGDVAALISFALIIGLVYLIRRAFVQFARCRPPAVHPAGIVFSREGGRTWASWPGAGQLCLGHEEEVAEMMADYLAQVELGKRLTRQPA